MHGHDPASIPAPARRPKPRNLGRNVACTCITAPCATGIFGAHLGASSGPTSVRPHDAASRMSQARMVFEGRVQIKVACSKALCCTMVLPIFLKIIAPNRSLSSSAPTSSRPTTAMPPWPETCRRRPGPSGPRRSAPSCWPVRPAPASAACASASRPAKFPAGPQHGHGV